MRKLSLIVALMLAVSLCVPTLAEEAVPPMIEEQAEAAAIDPILEEDAEVTPDAEAATPLTCAEVEAWAQELLDLAAREDTRNDPAAAASRTDDGFMYEYPFGTLYLSTPRMQDDTQLLRADIVSDAVYGPHGTTVYMFADEVMANYRCDNAQLTGTRESALLYAGGELPDDMRWGCIYRDGQRLQEIEYASLEPAEEGYTFVGVSYTVADNMVMAIHVYGLGRVMDDLDVSMLVSTVENLRNDEGYRQVAASSNGADLAMFSEEDLLFAGMDLRTLVPEQLILLLGDVQADEWTQVGTEGFIRQIDFMDCSLTVDYDNRKQHPQLDTLCVTTDRLEGPRCLRLGDSLTSVRNRFRYGEGEFDEETMIETLYALEDGAVSGQADYSMNGMVIVRYQVPLADGRSAVMMLTFEQMYLTEMMLVLQ